MGQIFNIIKLTYVFCCDYISHLVKGYIIKLKIGVKFMEKQIILTEEGLKNLESELETLKTVKRKEVAEKIKVALSFGDLSENSEYDEAKNEQALIESRIIEIEAMLKRVQVINEHELSTEIIHVGSKVKVEDLEYKEKVEYRIVGSSESDPREGKISDESPVGAALLGHKKGQTVEVTTPGGICKYKILSISK